MNKNIDTFEIAAFLVSEAFANDNLDPEKIEELETQTEEALYHIKTIAENPYNKDYLRTLMNVLQNLVDNSVTSVLTAAPINK